MIWGAAAGADGLADDAAFRRLRHWLIPEYQQVEANSWRNSVESQHGNQPRIQRRLTVRDAAIRLGISEDAVRSRCKRGTLEFEREGRRLYVLLSEDSTTIPTADRTVDPMDQLRTQIEFLEAQLAAEREANRQNKRIIAALSQQRMDGQRESTESPPTSPIAPTLGNLGSTLLLTAWLAISLGLAMEVLLLFFAAGFEPLPGLNVILADLVRLVAWSVLVCVGLACGTAASKYRTLVMGLIGFLSAPLAFICARTLHKGILEALGAAGDALGGTSVFLIALLKGVEYGVLGAALGYIGRHPWAGLAEYAAVGMFVGSVFGGGMVTFKAVSLPELPPTADLISQMINEVLFPVGCSLILFFSDRLVKRAAQASEG